MNWMFVSDLIPLILLITNMDLNSHNTQPLWGPIISRLCSLLYHAHESTHPTLLYLDYLGICSMALSVPAACAMAEKGWGVHVCGPFNAGVAVATMAVVAELGMHAFCSKRLLFASAEHAVVGLGIVGNLPVLAIIACPYHQATPRLLFAFSLLSYATGYFILKPTHHVLWHWAAAAAQAAGVAAVEFKVESCCI